MAVMRRVSHLPAAAFVLVFSTLGTHAWAADTRLADAAMKRDVATVRKLLDEKVDVNAPGADGTPALHWLVRVDDFDTARRLIRAGADPAKPQWILPNSVPGFGHGIGIVRGGLPDRGARFLIPGAMTPLLYAARDGRIESAKTLIAAGADIEHTDANGITPLLMAITNDHA